MNPLWKRLALRSVLAGLVLFCSSWAVSAQLAIVNPTVDQREISRSAARALFGMRMLTWPDGTAVRVFVMDDREEEHIQFVKSQLHVFPHQLRQAWDRLVYSGIGQAPIRVKSAEEMLRKVSTTPGGIGYLPETTIDDSVRVIHIE